MLAGGVEGGDVETVLFNAELLAELPVRPIVIYGGNSAVADEGVRDPQGRRVSASATPPTCTQASTSWTSCRRAPSSTTRSRSTSSTRPGMERIGELVTGAILPTPGAVLVAAERLAETLGGLVVIDVGGATQTCTRSPTAASRSTPSRPSRSRTASAPWRATWARTSARPTWRRSSTRARARAPAAGHSADGGGPARSRAARRVATVTGVYRHAGSLAYLYTPTGRQTVARGRDLTACRYVVGTGGALTRLPGGLEALRSACARGSGERLLPPADARCLLDSDYIFAVCGALSRALRRRCVVRCMLHSIGVDPRLT